MQSLPLTSPLPQVCMHLLVNALKTFLAEEMIAHLYRMDPDELMEESPEEAQRRDELLAMFESSKMALEIIKNVNVKAEPLPPPVENDLQVGLSLPVSQTAECLDSAV